MLKENSSKFRSIHRLMDLSILILSWVLAYLIRFYILPDGQQGLFGQFTILLTILIVVSAYVFEKNKLYTSFRLKSLLFEITQVTKSNFTVFIILIFALYFLKDQKISRIHLGIFLMVSTVMLVLSRVIKHNILSSLRSRGKNLRYVQLLGNGDSVEQYKRLIKKHKECGIKITEDESKADAVILGYALDEQAKLKDFLKKNYNSVKQISILPDLPFSVLGDEITDFDGLSVIHLNQPTFPIIELSLKRIIDLIASTIGMLFISPLLILVSIGVKLSSPGPIFYGQERIGLDGKKFKMWKFRSMRVATENEDLTTWSSKNEPRKTKFGEFIRKTSIDELPQLWNILTGEMSLVGPRPERPHFVDKFKDEIPNYMLRHKMKAGLTGWAQVNGWRGDTSLVKRIECDIYYIKNWSIWLDIKIILLTFVKGFVNKNAY